MKSWAAFAQDVLSQALGTLLAAGVVLLIGKAAGFLPGVNWKEVAAVGLAVLGTLITLVGVASGWKVHKQQQAEASQEQIKKRLAAMTLEENVAINAYFDKGRWNNLDPEQREKFEALIVQMVTREV